MSSCSRHSPPRAGARASGKGRVTRVLLAANWSDEGTVLWKISHIFFVNVESKLNVNSRPFHWSCGFACCYLGHSHSAEERVRIFLAMETFKSLHSLICRGPEQEFMAPCRGAGEGFGFRCKFLSGLDTIVPVSWPTGLQRRILHDGLSCFLCDCMPFM